jgi:sulfatase modifying factor 1
VVRRTRVRTAIALAGLSCAALLVTHCSQVTELFVVVDSDLTNEARIDAIRITVDAPSGTYVEREAQLAEKPLPVTLGVQAGSDDSSSLTVTATALRGGVEVARQTVRTHFVPGENKVLPIALCASCVGVQCGASERCDGGRCIGEDVPAASLPPFGAVSRLTCGGPPGDGSTPNARPPTSCLVEGPGLSDCGAKGNESCCTTKLVSGGEFQRNNDSATLFDTEHPATVSDVRLDRYEVSVGRFRRFISAVVDERWRPLVGTGKHQHLRGGRGVVTTDGGDEAGWNGAWSDLLATTRDEWTTRLRCDLVSYDFTFDDVFGSDTKPITCVTWFEAAAFCIWDNGFLPTEAEWGYAASGGGGAGGQRFYPWSSPPAESSLACEQANHRSADLECQSRGAQDVGASSPQGDGAFGQADLAGNAWEWTLDAFVATFTVPCVDCVQVASVRERVIRGGGFNDGAYWLANTNRLYADETKREASLGFRCARSP